MNIAELIHDDDHLEVPSNVDLWANKIGAVTTRYKVFEGHYPKLENTDLVIVHGGAQHLWQKANDPWLRTEIDFIRDACEANVPVIGFCLGCQIISEAFGGRVFLNEKAERGFYNISFHADMQKHPLLKGCEDGFSTFLWHMDHFTRPSQFVSLAWTECAPNQVIAGLNVPAVGYQFHPEYTKVNIQRYLENNSEFLWRTENGLLPAAEFIETLKWRKDTYELFEKLVTNAMDYLRKL